MMPTWPVIASTKATIRPTMGPPIMVESVSQMPLRLKFTPGRYPGIVICSNSKAPAMAPKMTVMATCRALRMGFLWTSSVWLLEDCIRITPYSCSGPSLHRVHPQGGSYTTSERLVRGHRRTRPTNVPPTSVAALTPSLYEPRRQNPEDLRGLVGVVAYGVGHSRE